MKRFALIAPLFLALASGPAVAQSPVPVNAVERARSAEISEGMQTLISEFVGTSIRMAATDISGDTESMGVVAKDRTRALAALAFHPAENAMELAAKLAAITEFSEDTERFALRATVEDANRIAVAEE